MLYLCQLLLSSFRWGWLLQRQRPAVPLSLPSPWHGLTQEEAHVRNWTCLQNCEQSLVSSVFLSFGIRVIILSCIKLKFHMLPKSLFLLLMPAGLSSCQILSLLYLSGLPVGDIVAGHVIAVEPEDRAGPGRYCPKWPALRSHFLRWGLRNNDVAEKEKQ